MSGDLIASLLGKLSERTGREWTLADIMKLAEKMPKGGTENIDSVLADLSEMGLDLSDETKERVKSRMKSEKTLSFEDLGLVMPKDVKGQGQHIRKSAKASGKSKHLAMARRIQKMSGAKKKKR